MNSCRADNLHCLITLVSDHCHDCHAVSIADKVELYKPNCLLKFDFGGSFEIQSLTNMISITIH